MIALIVGIGYLLGAIMGGSFWYLLTGVATWFGVHPSDDAATIGLAVCAATCGAVNALVGYQEWRHRAAADDLDRAERGRPR